MNKKFCRLGQIAQICPEHGIITQMIYKPKGKDGSGK